MWRTDSDHANVSCGLLYIPQCFLACLLLACIVIHRLFTGGMPLVEKIIDISGGLMIKEKKSRRV